jgi:hypothetical protein
VTTVSSDNQNVDHVHSIPAEGSGSAHSSLQPTIITNYILFAGA